MMKVFTMRILQNSIFLLVIGIGLTNALTAEKDEQATKDLQIIESNPEETGKLYFTGTGYTVNLIPHAIVVGLLTFAIIFLYGDSLFGSDISTGYGAPTASYGAPAASYDAPAASYGAPAPAYGAPAYAANRYYDPYAADAVTALGSSPYAAELNPYNLAQEPAAAVEGRK